MAYLNVGHMARENCISSRALRFYQEKGLIEPEYIDETNGRRYYSIVQSPRIDLIVQLQQAGFSLDEIREIARRADMGQLQEAVAEKLSEVSTQIEALRATQRTAQEILRGLQLFHETPIRNKILFARLPERLIVRLRPAPANQMRLWEQLPVAEQMEWTQCFIKKQLVERGLPLSLLHNSGTLVEPQDLCATTELFFQRPFVTVLPQDERGDAEVLEGGNCLVMYASFDERDPADRARPRIERMLDYLQAKDLEIAGPFVSESISRFEHYFHVDKRPFYRMSVPVRGKHAWCGCDVRVRGEEDGDGRAPER